MQGPDSRGTAFSRNSSLFRVELLKCPEAIARCVLICLVLLLIDRPIYIISTSYSDSWGSEPSMVAQVRF